MERSYKNIAYLNFWLGLFNPKNGGNLRAHGLFNALNKVTQATLIRVNEVHPDSEPPTWDVYNIKGKSILIHEFISRIFSVITGQGLFLNTDIKNTLIAGNQTNWFEDYSHVLFTSREMLLAAPLIRMINNHVQLIYDSHNVDYLLAESGSFNQKKIRFLEWLIPYLVDEVWCCSEIDRVAFIQLNGRFKGITKVVPNGSTTREFWQAPGKIMNHQPTVGIISSWSYIPNIEGLEWFLTSVLPRLDNEVQVIICGIGTLPTKLIELIDASQKACFIGPVEDVSQFYQIINVVAIPLQKGSGTRLKALEAMSFAKPIVTTSKGIEGISLKNKYNCLVADESTTFADAVNLLLKQKDYATELGTRANNQFQMHYTWEAIVQNLMNESPEVTKT